MCEYIVLVSAIERQSDETTSDSRVRVRHKGSSEATMWHVTSAAATIANIHRHNRFCAMASR